MRKADLIELQKSIQYISGQAKLILDSHASTGAKIKARAIIKECAEVTSNLIRILENRR